ncbi:thioesterase II family protein [Streptomyces sp. SHP 1-2]|uniref:thioesterase II family protein n=1 Tax=Streptomyces sp. SHP 1-2 TaxID=2769489 RepID=UPI002238ADB6|nr:alpha/beta fold hydrolase [Streptomyces sp. SHP 1-2]MCW5250402.1 alpha/beta fold hydrolase [Streptomyces sp. SHP 1-2]
MTGDGHQLILFPGAGAFGSEFHALRSAAGADSAVMRYPGRSTGEAASFEAVVAACADRIAGRPDSRPVLFGHSYGAYLAYATAIALARRSVDVSLLIVAGAAAPDLLRVPPEATVSPEAAVAYLDEADPGRLAAAAPEWREAVAETLQRDLRVLATLTLASPPTRVPCPVLALRGAEDPLTSDASLAGWERFTRGGFDRRTLEGGHSGVLDAPDLAALVRERLTRKADPPRTTSPSPDGPTEIRRRPPDREG